MKLPSIKQIFGRQKRYSITDMGTAMDLLIAGRPTSTGVNVTANTAMNCVPYMAGVRLISETIGQLPLIEYRRLQPRGKERAIDRKLYTLLHDEPNPEMSAVTFKETLQGHAVTWGNAFAEIQWDYDMGVPLALWPLRPDKMKVGRDQNNEIFYLYRLPDGTDVKLPAYRIWHMPGFGFDGLIGYDTIYLAREAIGMAMAMEEFGARFFGNGAAPGGVLEHPNKLSSEAQNRLRTSWNEMHQGLTNQHRIAILEEGMSYKQVGIPPDNAQFLESRKFQLNEIARLLHIPPHMLADLDRATFSNIEHQAIEFVTYTMGPWFTRWEETCNRKLLLSGEKKIFFFEFLVDALLRGDSSARANFYKELFYLGVLSPNDIRELENMNPIDDPGGNKYYIQSNMLPMDKAGQVQPPPQPAPTTPPATTKPEEKKSLNAAVLNITQRNKNNIIRAYQRAPDKIPEWAEDYSRDFTDYMLRQLNNNHSEVENVNTN